MEYSSEIHNDITSFNDHHLHPFIQKHRVFLENIQKERDEAISTFQQDYMALYSDKVKLTTLYDNQLMESRIEENKVKELEKNIQQLELHKNLLPNQINLLKNNEEINMNKIEQLKREVDTLTTNKLREIDAVTKGVEYFQRYLAIYFSVENGKLKITFKNIDLNNAEKEFSCWIFVDENKEYQGNNKNDIYIYTYTYTYIQEIVFTIIVVAVIIAYMHIYLYI